MAEDPLAAESEFVLAYKQIRNTAADMPLRPSHQFFPDRLEAYQEHAATDKERKQREQDAAAMVRILFLWRVCGGRLSHGARIIYSEADL